MYVLLTVNLSSLYFDVQKEEKRIRVNSFANSRRDVLPFVNHQLRITFADQAEYLTFCSQKISVRLPVISYAKRNVVENGLYSTSTITDISQHLLCMPISVAFQIETLLHNGLLSPVQILRICQVIESVDCLQAERALVKFIGLYNSEEDYVMASERKAARHQASYLKLLREALEATAADLQPNRPEFESGDYFLCRTVTITPTKFILEGPLPERSNSVIRQYSQPENFLRVCFRDENGSMLRASRGLDISALLRTRYLPFLNKGLVISGRTFEFLGYSNSALKDHQAWFVCPFYKEELVNAASIRSNLGDFSKVKYIPARYMARIAQAFTSTQRSITVRRQQIRQRVDIERGGSCFTDGVGTISQSLAEEVDKVLSSKLSARIMRRAVGSTCYQIRLGGFKGMLSIDPTLKTKVIRMRPSMNKFDAPDSRTLDIAGVFTRPLIAYLNRPLIKILEDLGIPDEVFLTLQKQVVARVETSRTSLTRSAKLMEQSSMAASSGMPSILKGLGRLLGPQANHCSRFIDECLDLMVMQCLRDLKYRARIPLENSYTLVGVADEDDFLQPDEIYACIQHQGAEPIYLEGPLTISRSPCLHPGDVRVVTGVGKLDPILAPRLNYLVNCVAFSVQGLRSLPSCLGGGDLDGDLYTLIGLPELVPDKSEVHQPASYDPPTMKRLNRECTIEDGAKFFLDYITNDLVGLIASRHLHLADHSPEGTRDPLCLELAKLHSDAVDYQKTGVPVRIHQLPNVRHKMKPDFMCPEHNARREGEDYYESSKVLGKLFRQIPQDKIDILLDGTSASDGIQSYRARRSCPSEQPLGKVDPSRTISTALQRAIMKICGRAPHIDSVLQGDFRSLLAWFGQELMKVCRLNTLSRRKDHHLSESESFLGVLPMMISDKSLRRTTLARLEDQTSQLYDTIRSRILGLDSVQEAETESDPITEEIESQDRSIDRAYTAWLVSLEADDNMFGVHSFAFIAMGIIFNNIAQ